MNSAAVAPLRRAIPLWVIVACAFAFHGPLLVMRLPEHSFDAHFHMSMASTYAEHWFDPWNEKSLGGFSETTYPPLTHQWIAMLSHVIGLAYGFMVVMGTAILLLPVGVYRFSKLWVNERAASYGAFCSIFLGSLGLLAYHAGQIGTISATTLFLLALPFAYEYVVRGTKKDLFMGLGLACTAAAAHHATMFFGLVFFVPPVFWLMLKDWRTANPEGSVATPLKRMILFAALGVMGILLVLLPYLMILIKAPITETPIPHLSRANFLLQPMWGMHFWVIPMGLLILALPYIFYKGCAEPRLRPLFFGFYFALVFGLGGTTPLPRWVLGRAFEILTFERFTYWALLLAMPIVGLMGIYLIDRFHVRAAVLLVTACIAQAAMSVSWNVYFNVLGPAVNAEPVIHFLNENGHDRYRYLTLGFGNALSQVACYTKATSIDGEYNSGRSLPEVTSHGSAQLSSSKFYGSEGMLSLSDMLKHANRYGLRYIFVHDPYYEPMLTFGGWHKIESDYSGQTTVWDRPDVPLAEPIPSPLRPPRWQGIMWGIVPFGASLITITMAGLRARQTAEEQRDITIGESDVRPEQPPLDATGPGAAPVLPSTT
ncbi:MAG TPA: hypothetical protein VFO46_15115 [Candidatus Sulfotelmatobacter sp.]|nr:hypothetical protein [Candidatus Sulfotelmatobacter sp.]